MPVTTIADLLRLLTREPGRPRITWYADDGERVELSGAVLENWVNKTANLLVEELDAGPGVRVRLDLPVHWRTVVWALAAWRVGACVVLDEGESGSAADITVTDRPQAHANDASQLVAVTLPALARRFDGTLPVGAVDAASAVMTYADAIGWAPTPASGNPALSAATLRVDHGTLLTWSSAGQPTSPVPARVLLVATPAPLSPAALAEVVGVLVTDGSVVVVDPPLAEALTRDPARTARLTSSERITRVPDTLA